MLCRLTRLIAVCTVAVWCAPGHAGLWDAPPLPNADFGAGGSNPTAFKTVSSPASVEASAIDPAAYPYDAIGDDFAATPESVPVYTQAPVYGPSPVFNEAPVFNQPPVYSQGPLFQQAPRQPFVAPNYAVPQMRSSVSAETASMAPTLAGYPGMPCGPGAGAEPLVDPMALAQATYSGGGVNPQWGLFRPAVNSGGGWGRYGARRPRFYGGSDYLYWVTRGQRFPALLTTSPDGTPINEAGRLDYPATTTVIYGDGRRDSNEHSGYRTYIGMNLDCAGCNRIEADYLNLNEEDFYFERSAPADYGILARPFYNTWLGTQDAELVGYPGEADGQMSVSGSTDFSGYGVWLRHNLLRCGPSPCGRQAACDQCRGAGCGSCATGACGPGATGAAGIGVGYGYGSYGVAGGQYGGVSPYYPTGTRNPRNCWKLNRLDLIAGYRHYDLEEDVHIREYLQYVNPAGAIPVGTEFDILDNFRTENKFDGGELGVDWEWTRGRFGMSVMGKTAIGNLRQRGCVDGFTSVWAPGNPSVNYNYGLMALESNSGSVERNIFTVIPELGLDVFYQLSCRSRIRVGYSMIYFPDVIRPAGLMDTNLDPQLFPPATATGRFPQNRFDEEDFWVQGLRLGAEFCF